MTATSAYLNVPIRTEAEALADLARVQNYRAPAGEETDERADVLLHLAERAETWKAECELMARTTDGIEKIIRDQTDCIDSIINDLRWHAEQFEEERLAKMPDTIGDAKREARE